MVGELQRDRFDAVEQLALGSQCCLVGEIGGPAELENLDASVLNVVSQGSDQILTSWKQPFLE